eukprot:Gb_34680 [translate_table: standard]
MEPLAFRVDEEVISILGKDGLVLVEYEASSEEKVDCLEDENAGVKEKDEEIVGSPYSLSREKVPKPQGGMPFLDEIRSNIKAAVKQKDELMGPWRWQLDSWISQAIRAGVIADDIDIILCVHACKLDLDKFQDHNTVVRTGFEHNRGGKCMLHVYIARPCSKQHPTASRSVSSISGYHDIDDVVPPISRGVPHVAERGSSVCDGNGSVERGHSNLVDQFQHGIFIIGVFGVHGSLQEENPMVLQ